jgi:hypothetical protein
MHVPVLYGYALGIYGTHSKERYPPGEPLLRMRASAPKALYELELAIDKRINSEQWTGDQRKTGPFGTTCFERSR